jgi:hypothetical protein
VRYAAVAIMVIVTWACGHSLNQAEAERVVKANAAAARVGEIRVDGISQSDRNEAIVRARFGSTVLNLRLRRYDTGWVWEFAETVAGGWVTPEKAVEQIREERRGHQLKTWLAANEVKYVLTVAFMGSVYFGIGLPDDPKDFTIAGWMKSRKRTAEFMRKQIELPTYSPESKAISMAIQSALVGAMPKDAWGNEISTELEEASWTFVAISNGADGIKGTKDDVVYTAKGHVERRETRLKYLVSWTLPEGIDDLGLEHVEFVRLFDP